MPGGGARRRPYPSVGSAPPFRTLRTHTRGATPVQEILQAITSGDPAAVAGLKVPESYRGVVVRKN